MALNLANVELSDSFNVWRLRTNSVISRAMQATGTALSTANTQFNARVTTNGILNVNNNIVFLRSVAINGTTSLTVRPTITFSNTITFNSGITTTSVTSSGNISGTNLTVSQLISSGAISGTTITGTSGNITGGLTVSGAITSASLAASGSVSGSNLSASSVSAGSLTATSFTLSGAMTGTTVSLSGAMTGTTASLSGSLSADSVTSSNALTGKNLSLTGPITGATTLTVVNSITANTVTAADYNSTSDLKYKSNIQTISNPLEKVQKLTGVGFNWKETDRRSIGFIAQEVEKILPEIVSTDEKNIKYINYGVITALLVEAVKEQQKTIEELKLLIQK